MQPDLETSDWLHYNFGGGPGAWGLPSEREQRCKALAVANHRRAATAVHGQSGRRRTHDAASAADPGIAGRPRPVPKQRDSLQSELDNPALSDRSKDVLRGSMAELDRSIADRRAALNRVESGSD